MSHNLPSQRGRPRKENIEGLVRAAAIELIDHDKPVTVNAVVDASGVNRGAIYRRWPRMNVLIAEALDEGRAPVYIDTTRSIKQGFAGLFFHRDGAQVSERGFRRMRRRLALVMGDPALQAAYWDSHVRRRRETMVNALRLGVERGELRADLDVEAAVDILSGLVYYQFVVRGIGPYDAAFQARVRSAFEIAWRGFEDS